MAVPTETFYALAADPLEDAAVAAHLRDQGAAGGQAAAGPLRPAATDLARLGVEAESPALDPYFGIWPAPLTVVVPIRAPIAASRGRSHDRRPSSGLQEAARPALPVGPVTGTSINRSGAPPLESPEAVEAEFRREIVLLVDGGKTPGGKPSTLVDATREPPVVLRAGAYPWPAK